MDTDFIITTGPDGLPKQTFNGNEYSLYAGARYFSRGRRRMHRDVWKFFNGEIPKGFDIHHINNNPWDNKKENLQCLPSNIHRSEHGKERFKDTDFKIKFYTLGIEAAKLWHKSDEGRSWHKIQSKQGWENRPYFDFTCQECGNIFKSKSTTTSKYCHLNCKMRAYNRKKRNGSI